MDNKDIRVWKIHLWWTLINTVQIFATWAILLDCKVNWGMAWIYPIFLFITLNLHWLVEKLVVARAEANDPGRTIAEKMIKEQEEYIRLGKEIYLQRLAEQSVTNTKDETTGTRTCHR